MSVPRKLRTGSVGWHKSARAGGALATCTHKRTLGVLQGLREHAVDVPDDLGDS